MRTRPPDPEYLELLAPYGGTIRDLALATRRMVLTLAPEANEFVYEVYTIANHFGFTERPSEAFAFTTTHAKWVNLGFNFGAHLPDPNGLLQGEGKLIRHVRIAEARDLDRPGVHELILAAMADAERPATPAQAPRIIIRRAGQTPKRARRASSPRL
ncbi:MAG: DUF1801 domain-containing protein [Acidobacteria bacterium]|nr:DUF1801 domain-containing protein [Acidobacteriota bacterium]